MQPVAHRMQAFWDHEEFEDYLVKGILACYETLPHREMANIDPTFKMRRQDLFHVQSVGPYFPPVDRLAPEKSIDLTNDTLLNVCSLAGVGNDSFPSIAKQLPDKISGYCNIGLTVRVKRLPSSHLMPRSFMKEKSVAAFYKVLSFIPFSANGYLAFKDYMVIGSSGDAYSCPAIKRYWKNGIPLKETVDSGDETATMGAGVINLYNDRRFLWNVVASEGKAKVTFGVYEEQIKSLFYARDLPLTATGRKRPILHWVAAHRRRMKSGVDIDIIKHLRGCSGFDMLGTRFDIINPVRPLNVSNRCQSLPGRRKALNESQGEK